MPFGMIDVKPVRERSTVHDVSSRDDDDGSGRGSLSRDSARAADGFERLAHDLCGSHWTSRSSLPSSGLSSGSPVTSLAPHSSAVATANASAYAMA